MLILVYVYYCFSYFFLSLGSVCGVDGDIADDVAIVDEIGCDGNGIVCVGSENGGC